MQKMSKQTMWWVLGALVVIVIVIAVVMMKKKNQDNASVSQNQETVTPAAESETSTGTTPNLSYTQALAKYGTNRIQIKADCQTVPNNVTYKSGTQVMFDNRSATSHTITFKGVKYVIAGYGYRVFTMTASTYPTTVLVDCDGSQNVATILIQR